MEAITGLAPVEDGHVFVDGKDITNLKPRAVTESGIAHVPEDRHKHGLVLGYPIDENLMLQTYYLPPFSKRTFIQPKAVRENAETAGRRIRCPDAIHQYTCRKPFGWKPAEGHCGA